MEWEQLDNGYSGRQDTRRISDRASRCAHSDCRPTESYDGQTMILTWRSLLSLECLVLVQLEHLGRVSELVSGHRRIYCGERESVSGIGIRVSVQDSESPQAATYGTSHCIQ